MKIYKIPLRLVYLFFLLFLFSHCSTDAKKNKPVSSLGAKTETLILPDSLEVYKTSNENGFDSIKAENATLKIYSFIDVSCSSCLSSIKNWNEVAKQFKEYNIPVILICQSEDNYELLKYLCEKKEIPDLPFPLYFDKKKQFFVRNKFLNPAPNNHTVLTDKNNKVLVSGDLTLSESIGELYIEAIRENKG